MLLSPQPSAFSDTPSQQKAPQTVVLRWNKDTPQPLLKGEMRLEIVDFQISNIQFQISNNSPVLGFWPEAGVFVYPEIAKIKKNIDLFAYIKDL